MNDRQLDINVRHAFVVLDLHGGGRVTAELEGGTGMIRVSQDDPETAEMFMNPFSLARPNRPGLRVELAGQMQTVTFADLRGAQFRDVPRDHHLERYRW